MTFVEISLFSLLLHLLLYDKSERNNINLSILQKFVTPLYILLFLYDLGKFSK